MNLRQACGLAVLTAIAPMAAFAGKLKSCVSIEDAVQMVNKDICISAHIYDVVQLSDGTRFLDVCSPATADDACRFTIVSLKEDREEVGELDRYRDADVRVRGIVRPMHGRAGIVLSHARQFHGGPPKFRPNPMLAHGFGGEDDRPPVADPNLHAQGGGRSFMNSRDEETRTAK
jgi:hypothetical protein